MAVSSSLNGERAVVLLFIARIIYSTPSFILLEALSFSLLSLFAFLVEVSWESFDSLSGFKTRPGASSGILLGAVTLPGVAMSKLVQLSRALSSHEIGVEELKFLQLQYWATSVTCFSVLVFLYLIHHRQSSKKYSTFLPGDWSIKVGAGCVLLFTALCCMSFGTKSQSGWNAALTLALVVLHGLMAVKFIQHVLHTFPACASLGEALLVTAGLVIYFGDMFAFTVAKIINYFKFGFYSIEYGVGRSEIVTLIQGMMLGLLVSPVIFRFVLPTFEGHTSSADSQVKGRNEVRRSAIFCASVALILFVIVPSWMQFVHDFPVHPYIWVFKFVLSEPLKRISLCIYWVAVIYASVLRFYNISKNSKIERILLRKYYHLMAVLMFLPALIFQTKFLNLAFGVALGAFLVLEIIRVWRIWPLGPLVHQFMTAFTDHRDSDLLIVSHFSLLLGCALPIWMSSGFNDRPLAPFAGILSLGIGDTMASLVGHKYGVLRWSKTGKKTIEGTAAGITSVLGTCFVLLPLLAATGHIFTQHRFSLIFAVMVSGLLEAYTAQLDNAFIPLIFYSLLCL